jgi:hypothetical protein
MDELFSKEDIEKFGFIYEPDETKCKSWNSGLHFDCNYYKYGDWTSRNSPELTDEWKQHAIDWIKERTKSSKLEWKHINSIWVPSISPMQGEGVMCRRVYVKGH